MNDNLVYASSMLYNTSPIGGMFAYSDGTSNSGWFYAQSKVKLYNENGYDTHYANKTLYVTITTGKSESYELNDWNETYGSGLLADKNEIEPDLISAIGTDGKKGYVRSEDIDPAPKTIKEAIEMTNMAFNDRLIPLYDLNGEIVGQFVLKAVQEDKLQLLVNELE